MSDEETPQQKAKQLEAKARAERKRQPRPRFRLNRFSPIFKLFTILGPGLIAANAGNDAGGIATFSSGGASYGYNLLWALIIAGLFLIVVQEMCARMGVVTGKGLADLIREQFGVRWTVLAMLSLLIANTGVTISEFLGISASVQVLSGSTNTPLTYIIVPLCGIALWWLVTRGSYRRVEKIFLIMSLGFLAYIPAAFAAHPSWSEVGQRIILPKISSNSQYIAQAIALVGTTISPYMQFFVQSSVADKGISASEYGYEQVELYSGTIFAILIAGFVFIATGATLFVHGKTVSSALDAALALQPFAGRYATLLFGIGLFGASLLAAAVLPLSTSYGICEAFGFERGVSRTFQEAPVFQGLFTGLIALGVIVTLFIPGSLIVPVLIALQVLNAVMLPILLIFIVLLVNKRRLMGRYVNSFLLNIIAWAVVVVIAILIILYLLTNVLNIPL